MVCMEGRISRQLLAKVVDFEHNMKIQVLDMTPCLCQRFRRLHYDTDRRAYGRADRTQSTAAVHDICRYHSAKV